MNQQFIKNFNIYRLAMPLANTEYSQALSTRNTRITITSDDLSAIFLFSFINGGSSIGKRIFPGSEWESPGFIVGSKTIYIQSPNADAVAVIEEWEAP